MDKGLILAVAGKPAISNICVIMIPDGADIDNTYIDYRYVGPGSIAFTTCGDKMWRLGENMSWVRVVNTDSIGMYSI